MEILNNLWLAVSTPNETLIDVILIIGIFIENSLVLGLFTTILNISPKTFQKNNLHCNHVNYWSINYVHYTLTI